jgi:nucleotide-binding universal stress UspA family protein
MKILVAVDGSEYTKRMLAYLAAHDEWLGNKHDYTILHVVAAVPPGAANALDRETLKSYYDDEAERVFAPVRAFFKQQGMNAQFEARVGHAAEVIAKFADDGRYDLVAMGSHGTSTLGRLVMGSVATKVLGHCQAPVLLVR